MLTLNDVTVRFGTKAAAENVSFSVKSGQWWMIAGPNGAGKSTLIRAVARALPFSGRILWGEREIGSFKTAEYAKKVGVLSQINRIEYGFTVEEVVRLGRYAYQTGILRRGDAEGEEKVREALRRTGMEEMRSRPVTSLSGGESQRAFLAQVLAQDPRLLILDEPANHLDLPYQQQLFSLLQDWLRAPGRAVISVVHDLALARRYGTHALLMREGKALAAGDISAALTRENLRAAYDMDVYAWMRDMLKIWSSDS